ncbi:MAG: hypothetical protein AAF772_16005 [Acidobacteriota bacterium]
MRNQAALLIASLLLAAAAVVTLAQQPAGQTDARYEGREHIKIDHEAMASMTREERRAAMQAYKAARAEEAARAGDVIPEGRQINRLATPRQVVEPAGRAPLAVGTIQYDTGTIVGTGGVASQMLGNRFDTALNTAGTACCFPVPTSGSITMITFDMVNTFFNSAVFSIYSNISGTMAAQVTSMAFPGIMTGLNTLSVGGGTTANTYMNGAFLAGIWQFDVTMTGLAYDTGSNAGQGFHAITLNDGMTNGTMLTDFAPGGMGANAIFRVTGNVVTPVELLSFSIDE